MSPRYPTDRETLEKEVQISFYKAGGPGGQHRNKTETAVRIRHRPSGITASATERRSQSRNRDLAFERLIERLRSANRRRKKRVPTRLPKAARERRLSEKRHRADSKRTRRPPTED